MAIMDDILGEIINMDNEDKKNLLVYLRQGRYLDTPINNVQVDITKLDYLKGLSAETLDFIKMILENYDLNLYHSVAAIINGRYGSTLQEKFNYY